MSDQYTTKYKISNSFFNNNDGPYILPNDPSNFIKFPYGFGYIQKESIRIEGLTEMSPDQLKDKYSINQDRALSKVCFSLNWKSDSSAEIKIATKDFFSNDCIERNCFLEKLNDFIGQPGDSNEASGLYGLKENNVFKTGIDGIKHAVRDRKRSGADFIKTVTTGGVLHGITSKVDTSLFLDDELLAMTEEAHRFGMHVACHAHGREGIYRAVKANVDTIEHGTLIDEETIDLMIKKQTFLIPTQTAGFGINKPDILKQLPPEVRIKIDKIIYKMKINHKLAFEKGVRIAVGTDAGTPGNPHGTTISEIINMIENLGMTATQALQAATIQSAKAIKMEKEIGSIEIEKFADLVVCNGNPIEQISILKDPTNLLYVIKDGMIMAEKGKITYFNL